MKDRGVSQNPGIKRLALACVQCIVAASLICAIFCPEGRSLVPIAFKVVKAGLSLILWMSYFLMYLPLGPYQPLQSALLAVKNLE